MRTLRVKLFTFKELHEDSQKVAVHNHVREKLRAADIEALTSIEDAMLYREKREFLERSPYEFYQDGALATIGRKTKGLA